MEIRDQERDIISLTSCVSSHPSPYLPPLPPTHLNRFSPQDKERLRPLRQESRELMDQDILNLIRLLDLDANAHTVDAWLDQDALVLVSCDD